jgi:hypothetical protein
MPIVEVNRRHVDVPAALSSTVCEPHVPRPRTQPKHRKHRRWVSSSVIPGIAAVATGLAVTAGVVATGDRPDTAATLVSQAVPQAGGSDSVRELMDAERRQSLSRSDRRPAVDRTRSARREREPEPGTKDETRSGDRARRSEELGGGDPRAIAQVLLPRYGFSSDQFSCLDALWTKESGWDPAADNPTSSAYGIPQALPGSKMASAGSDWASNPATQIRWGLGYIADVYGSPCGAWSHSQANNWY